VTDLGQTRSKTLLGISHPSNPHVVISLIGMFKIEVGVLNYHIPVVATTDSGLEVKRWVGRLLIWYGDDQKGYVFRDSDGFKVTCGHCAQKILSSIQKIQQSDRPAEAGIIEPDSDVFEEFGMSRPFRR